MKLRQTYLHNVTFQIFSVLLNIFTGYTFEHIIRYLQYLQNSVWSTIMHSILCFTFKRKKIFQIKINLELPIFTLSFPQALKQD